MSSEGLEPCPVPWCRSDIVAVKHPNRFFMAECHKCGCTGPADEDRDAAIAAWNTRTLQTANAAMEARVGALSKALEWYGEQARLCRLIHSEGDAGRHALDADGGKRARTTLGE